MKTAYKLSFSTGGLFINESVELARLHREGESWTDTILRAVEGGTLQLPKAVSNRRTLREISNRLFELTGHEREFLINEADRAERQALLWIATCRAYAFVREFAVEVVGNRLSTYRPDLPIEAFDTFFEGKAECDGALASISASTRRKLRQVLFRMMREAGVLDANDTIQPTYLTSKLTALIASKSPADLLVFPGLQQ